MEIDNSVKDRSNIAKWVLVISVAVIILAIALGIGALNTYSEKILKTTGNENHYSLENTFLETNKEDIFNISDHSDDVSLAKGGIHDVKNTEKGTISLTYNIPEVLPLCITQEKLDSWSILAHVTGGYVPQDVVLTLGNKKEGYHNINIVWDHVSHTPCYSDDWKASFVLPDGVTSIELESNQWPDGATPCKDNPATIPGKEVYLCSCLLWKGCDCDCQWFWLIMAH